ncbi:acyl carrier protein [Herbaspirillum sp. RTI4]|uniref:acyl carrier protein n=1 Tax=Herbaspirillum sp. RTI4 TaxID=3048640 RepID=UPI002AB4AEFC|nr:acyl carrier protein [Herbaspirillum sp. RTI4]MDY7577041.1 acyl carrier protein [Herbaspirillum sp. RTI4]MEA9982221.1 acyl carrier protein [Herbaspirillum sp. RTI4]
MSIDNFSAEFADAIEVPPETVTGSTVFKDLEIWDSLAILVVIAMVDATYDVAITGDDLKNTSTVAELHQIVLSRSK